MPEIILNGAAGRTEALYAPAEDPKAPLALILHPHPQQGGTMNNKIVFAMHKSFRARGFTTLRYNSRGVGRSQGVFDRGEGELTDAAAILDWLNVNHPQAAYCWVGGFSFGGWLAMQLLMRRPEIRGFVVVAPPAGTYDFTFLAPCPTSGLMVQGGCDEIVDHQAVQQLAKQLSHCDAVQVRYHLVPQANHFFSDHMGTLSKVIDDYLDEAESDRLATAS
ncbi:MAG: alpha/beta hydrolase [Pseudomonadota bacterium]